MNEGKDRPLTYVDTSLDPRIEASIREIASIQAKIVALEVMNGEVKPEIKELREKIAVTPWGTIATWMAAFLTFMIFYAGLQRSMQTSDSRANEVGLEHTDQHLKDMEQKVRELREYVDRRDSDMRSKVFTKEEHELFDKQRTEEMRDIEARLLWLEHRPTK